MAITQLQSINSALIADQTRRVWDYWSGIKGAALAPTWASFELIDLYRDVPSLQVCDVFVDGEALTYRYRYVGSEIVNSRHLMAKPDFTGLMFDKVEYQYDFSEIRAAMDDAAGQIKSIHLVRSFDALDASGRQERLILPLVHNDDKIDKLVIFRTRLEQDQKVFVEDLSSF